MVSNMPVAFLRYGCSFPWTRLWGGYSRAPPHFDLRLSFNESQCKPWLPSWVYPVEVLQPYVGSEGEQHILAAASSKQQAASSKQQAASSKQQAASSKQQAASSKQQAASSKQQAASKQAVKKSVFPQDGSKLAHHHNQVLCYFEPSRSCYGRFSVQKWPFSACFEAVFRTIVLKVQDGHGCGNQVSQMQQ